MTCKRARRAPGGARGVTPPAGRAPKAIPATRPDSGKIHSGR
jgi:hypothetical protein